MIGKLFATLICGVALSASAVCTIERIPCRLEGQLRTASEDEKAFSTSIVNQISFYDTRSYEIIPTTTGVFRLSFDPQDERQRRIAAEITFFENDIETNVFVFGSVEIPINTYTTSVAIVEGHSYRFLIKQLDQQPGTNSFILGIGLESARTRFDPRVDFGKVANREIYDFGYDYTDGFPYGYLPEATPHDSAVCRFLGWVPFLPATANDLVKITDDASSATQVLFALWRYSYQVAFHENEGKGATVMQDFVSDQPSALKKDVWTRSGYELCWTNSAGAFFENGATVTNLVSVPAGTNHLYAVWRDKRSWIEFDANGGMGTMESFVYAYDERSQLPMNGFSSVGRVFSGWSTNAASTVYDYYNGETIGGLTDQPGVTNRLYAIWRDADDIIRIELTAAAVTNASLSGGRKILLAGISAAAEQTMVITNIAASASERRVSLDPEIGARLGLTATIEELRDDGWTQIAAVCDLTNEAAYVSFVSNGVYRFTLSAGAPGESCLIGIGFEGVAMTYDVAEGELVGASAIRGSNFNFTVSTPLGYLPEVRREEWHLLGWADAVTGGACGSNDAVRASVTMVQAQWRRDPFDYEVSFSSDEGTGSMENQTMRYDTSSALSANKFKRTGYVFDKWNCPSNGCSYSDKEVVLNLTENPGETVPLNATWSPIKYSVSFNANGGEGTSVVQAIAYGEEEKLIANTYVRLGYEFAGWSSTAGGSVEWEDRAVVSNLSVTANATVKLFAVWEEVPEYIIYENADTNDYKNVTVPDTKSVLFSGQLAAGATTTCYTATFAAGATCRVSLDPLTGRRSGAVLEIAELNDDGTWTTIGTLSDLATVDTVIAFAARTYRFSIFSSGSDGYRYVVGLGLQGLTVDFDPHRSNIPDSGLQLILNCSVGLPYGWYPELSSDTTNGTFLGWYETERGEGDALLITDTVATNRNHFIARWSGQTWTVEFDWNLPGTNLVERRYYADAAALGKLTQPSIATGTLIYWNTAADGSGTYYTATNSVTTNLLLFAQWYEGYVMSEYGSDGWIIDKYTGSSDTQLTIPAVVGERIVRGIGSGVFAGHTELTSVTIPSGVESVGAGAFQGCSALATVTFITEAVDENADSGYLENEILIGDGAFEDCTSLKSCDLPLGVKTLSAGVFRNCTALESYVIPFTVTEIAEEAFAGCTALTHVVVPEKTETIGSRAFGDCSALKNVDYLGNPPEVEEDIYENTLQKLVSRKFARCDEWAVDAKTWPTSEIARKLTTMSPGTYPATRVIFDMNNGSKETVKKYYHESRPFGWLAETPEEGEFQGWWTARIGGRQLKTYEQITEAITVYAHWTLEAADGRGANVSWSDGLSYEYETDPAEYLHSDRTYRGLILDSDGNVAGSIKMFCRGVGFNKSRSRHTSTAITAVIDILGERKQLELKGKINSEGVLTASNKRYQLSAESPSRIGFAGTLTRDEEESFTVQCFNSASAGAKANLSYKRRLVAGNWICQLPTGNVEDLGGGDSVAGSSVLSLDVTAAGAVKISAVMADGTRASRTTEVIFGDGYCCIPLVVPLYSGASDGFAGAVWMTWQEDMSVGDNDISLQGLSDWNATTRSAGAFIAQFDKDGATLAKQGSDKYEGQLSFTVDSCPSIDGVTIEESLLPQDTIITATAQSWRVPRADTVRFVDGEWVDLSEDQNNPAGLSISYSSESGVFTGSFAIRGITDGGNSRTYTAKITGAFIVIRDDDGTETAYGYGTATVSGLGNLAVTISPVD